MPRSYFRHCSPPSFSIPLEELHDAARQPNAAANPLGTVVFLSYIAGALILTGVILSRHTQAYHDLPHSIKHDGGFRSRLALLSFVSLISFSILSYNMLSFLISSFQSYHSLRGMPNFMATSDLIKQIWDWMYHSELFTSFAWDLVHPDSFAFIQSGLDAVLYGTVLISTLGKTHSIAMGPYVYLAQILPVSFSFAMLLVEILLRYPDRSVRSALTFATTPDLTSVVYAAISLTYLFLIDYVPCSLNSGQLMTLVLTSRALLAALGSANLSTVDCLSIIAIGYVTQLFRSPPGLRLPLSWKLSGHNWAVRTLSNDSIALLAVQLLGPTVLSYPTKGSDEKKKKNP